MSEILTDILRKISLKSINYYIEKNLDDFYNKASLHSNFKLHQEKKISWVLAKKADWPEGIYKAAFEDVNIEEEIYTIKNLIQEGKIPNGWTIGPLTTPLDLGNILQKFGFLNVYHQAGMAYELENLSNHDFDQIGLKIEFAENKEHLRQWMGVVSTVFGIKIDLGLLEYLRSESEVRFYIGSFEGEPVSSLMLYLSSGVAGIHAVSTLIKYRGRDFGLYISTKALLDAYEIGYRVGVLQASSMGERVYRKLGFKKYCDINTYALEF
ncbi:MAG: hypothetical protein ACFFDB_06820 [Promethearchaeota archaeon]